MGRFPHMPGTFGLLQARALGRLFVLCALVGVIAGFGAAGFHFLLNAASRLLLDGIAGYRPAGPGGEPPLFAPSARGFSSALLFILPVAGGLLSGLIVYTLAPEAEGHGTDAAIRSFHKFGGRVRARIAPIKTLASAITIGTGGSAGREGPIAQIGASFGSVLADLLKLSDRERRIMMAAGMGAGVGAIFHAPLAGAIFSAEVLYSEIDFEYEVIAPSILASIVAFSVFSLIFGWRPLFTTPAYVFRNPAELVPYTILGFALAAAGLLYVKAFYGTRNWFRKLRLRNHVKPALGGLAVGAIGLLVPDALASGYGVAQGALLGSMGAGFLITVALAKILTTSMTIGSGGSGGVFGPSVVIGGAVGGAVGLLLQKAMPSWVPHPGAFAMVGMAGFFAGVANTPLSTVIMVSEMTGNYDLLVPSMWVCTLSFLLLRKHGIYEEQMPTRASTPAHFAEAVGLVLRHFTVDDLLLAQPRAAGLPSVREDTPLEVVLQLLGETDRGCLPVMDRDGRLIGSVHLDTVRHVLGDPGVQQLIIARDVLTTDASVGRQESIEVALRAMQVADKHELLVPGTAGRPTDAITAADVVAAYERELEPADATQTPFGRSVFIRRLRDLISKK